MRVGVEEVGQLATEVERRYRSATSTGIFTRHPTRKVPDFRDHDGVRLVRMGVVVYPGDIADISIEDVAVSLVRRVTEFERALIVGAGDGDDVARCFLEGSETPAVFLKVPPHLRWVGTDDEDAIKLRHVFGVLEPTGNLEPDERRGGQLP